MLNYISMDTLKAKAQTTYQQANRLSRGTLGIFVYSIQSFIEANAGQASASIAYYMLFSLFPLLIFLITIASYFLESDQVIEQILEFVSVALPTAEELVAQNIEGILGQRNTMGIVAAIGLLWAATGVFAGLTYNINNAWHAAKPSNFLQGRLVGLVIVTISAFLLIMSVLSTTLFKLLPWADVGGVLWDEILLYETFTWQFASKLVPWFFTFVLCFGLYRWIPNTKVGWIDASIGAVLAATGAEITKAGFTWYLSSGLAKYDLIYGSLGTIIILMLSLYLVSLILLFSAHVSASISYHRHLKKSAPTKNSP